MSRLPSEKFGTTAVNSQIDDLTSVTHFGSLFREPFVSPEGRVVLSRFDETDICDEYLGWLNDRTLMRYSNQRFIAHTRDSVKRYLESLVAAKAVQLSIKDTKGALVGTMTAHPNFFHSTCDVGILVGPRPAAGKGFGSEAWRALFEHLEDSKIFRKITAGTNSKNIPMVKIFQSSGMVPDGVKRRHEVVEGIETDLVFYAKFRDQ